MICAPVVAAVFPGQGSQSAGMLAPWQGDRMVVDTIAEASDALGLDLWQLSEAGDAAALALTINTQPLMVAVSAALWRAWRQRCSRSIAFAAGHSVGELGALVAAQSLSLSDAMRIARRRALAMSAAVAEGTGTMAAVLGLDDATVQQLCTRCAEDGVLEPVNYNAPGQVVVAGHVSAIERLKSAARDAGAKMVFMLPVSGPFHSSLMQPAASALAITLDMIDVCPPTLPVLHNSSMAAATAASIKPELVAQLTSPVRWTETVNRMTAAGTTHVLEVGPGEVLTGLCRRIAPRVTAWPLATPQSMDAAARALE